MSTDIKNRESENKDDKAIRKIAIENALHMQPAGALTEIFQFKTIKLLYKLAVLFKVKNYDELTKPVLIWALIQKMAQPENLKNCLLAVSMQEWEFFKQAVSRDYLQSDAIPLDSYNMLQVMGLVQSFYYDDALWYVVPDEIKLTYTQLEKESFAEQRDLRELLNIYALAAVSLYGVIGVQEFVDIFNSQNDKKISVEQMQEHLLYYTSHGTEYCFYEDYMVHFSFEEDDFDGVKWILEQRKGVTRYTPPQEEFIRYCNPAVFADIPQAGVLQDKLHELFDEDKAEELFCEMLVMCRSGVSLAEYFDLLDSAGAGLGDTSQVKKMVDVIVDVVNNSRVWEYYGHTPNELGKGNVVSIYQPPGKKIGRNEPCPCGSGKKYKYCCGKSIQ